MKQLLKYLDTANIEDVALQDVRRYLSQNNNYIFDDIWQDPLIAKICKELDTNLVGLRNRDFQVKLEILPFVPELEMQRKETSASFWKMAAEEMLSDDRYERMIANAKEHLPKLLKKRSRLKGAQLGTVLGVLAFSQYMILVQDTVEPFSLPILMLTMQALRKLDAKCYMEEAAILNDWNAITGRAVGKLWAAEALKCDFKNNFFMGKSLDKTKTPETKASNSLQNTMHKTVHEAEDWGANNPGSFLLYAYTVQPSSEELGSSAFRMTVYSPPPEGRSPPDVKRKVHKKWDRRWTWLPRPALAS